MDEAGERYNCQVGTPWGNLAARFSKIGLVKAWFPNREKDDNPLSLQEYKSDERLTTIWSESLAAAVSRFLADGNVMLPLDLSPFRPWTRTVYFEVLSIPPGHTTTYGALARSSGRPGAARAVGAVLSRQPFAFFLPTHRVWPAHGGSGHCTSGAGHLRAELLRREGLI